MKLSDVLFKSHFTTAMVTQILLRFTPLTASDLQEPLWLIFNSGTSFMIQSNMKIILILNNSYSLFCRKDTLDVFNTVQHMRSQRMLMVPKWSQYHDIFKCLRDEICGEGTQRYLNHSGTSNVEMITEREHGYISHCTTEDHDYWDLDDMDGCDREYS